MNMYFEFVKDQYDRESIETDYGFSTYSIIDSTTCHIHNFYIRPEMRGDMCGADLLFSKLLMQLPSTITMITCHIDLAAKDPERKLRAFLKRGFKIAGATTKEIVCYRML
jgi:hypothetical protein